MRLFKLNCLKIHIIPLQINLKFQHAILIKANKVNCLIMKLWNVIEFHTLFHSKLQGQKNKIWKFFKQIYRKWD